MLSLQAGNGYAVLIYEEDEHKPCSNSAPASRSSPTAAPVTEG